MCQPAVEHTYTSSWTGRDIQFLWNVSWYNHPYSQGLFPSPPCVRCSLIHFQRQTWLSLQPRGLTQPIQLHILQISRPLQRHLCSHTTHTHTGLCRCTQAGPGHVTVTWCRCSRFAQSSTNISKPQHHPEDAQREAGAVRTACPWNTAGRRGNCVRGLVDGFPVLLSCLPSSHHQPAPAPPEPGHHPMRHCDGSWYYPGSQSNIGSLRLPALLRRSSPQCGAGHRQLRRGIRKQSASSSVLVSVFPVSCQCGAGLSLTLVDCVPRSSTCSLSLSLSLSGPQARIPGVSLRAHAPRNRRSSSRGQKTSVREMGPILVSFSPEHNITNHMLQPRSSFTTKLKEHQNMY